MTLKSIPVSIKPVLFAFTIALILFNSCIPLKKIKYVQKKTPQDTIETFLLKSRPKNTIQPFDNLYVRIISPDEMTSNMFNTDNYNVVNSNINYNMISYTVNDSGYISFPYAGEIRVKDLTVLQAKDTIQKAISQFISNSTVIVKFVGKSVTVIGEVFRQGEYVTYDDNVGIFSAIAMAGGITDFGDREHVTIIREVDNKARYFQVDLTDRNIIKSEFYYLKPEDIIIVSPLKQKSYGFASFPYAIVLSGMTTIIAFLTLLNTL